jgi:hypothetical protein
LRRKRSYPLDLTQVDRIDSNDESGNMLLFKSLKCAIDLTVITRREYLKALTNRARRSVGITLLELTHRIVRIDEDRYYGLASEKRPD